MNHSKKPTPLLAAIFTFIAAAAVHAAPVNDHFLNAQVLTGTYATADGTNVAATKQPSEPGSGGLASVWYSWIAPGNGSAEFGLLRGSSGWLVYEVYSGSSFSNLVKIDSEGGSAADRRIYAGVVQGDKLFLRVANDDAYGTTGTFTVSALLRQTFPSNDDFANARLLTGNNPGASASLKGATREAGELSSTGNNTLWYKWTAPSTGTTVFSSTGSQYPADTILSVFAGSGGSPAYLLSYYQGDARLSISTVAGVQYFLALGSANPQVFGTAVLSIAHTSNPGPPNPSPPNPGPPNPGPPNPPAGRIVTERYESHSRTPIGDLRTTTSRIRVSSTHSRIRKLTAGLNVFHGDRGDLEVQLISPSGAKADLFIGRRGDSAFSLKGKFNVKRFAGLDPRGVWRLVIRDRVREDGGTLYNWALTMKVSD